MNSFIDNFNFNLQPAQGSREPCHVQHPPGAPVPRPPPADQHRHLRVRLLRLGRPGRERGRGRGNRGQDGHPRLRQRPLVKTGKEIALSRVCRRIYVNGRHDRCG